jgi:hypothetical protein
MLTIDTQEVIEKLIENMDEREKATFLEQMRDEIVFQLEKLYGHNGG